MALRTLVLVVFVARSFAQTLAPAVAAEVNGQLITTEQVDRGAKKQIADIEEPPQAGGTHEADR